MTYFASPRKILCDGFDCRAVFQDHVPLSLESFARFRGWLVVGERHYCPKCRSIITEPKTGKQ